MRTNDFAETGAERLGGLPGPGRWDSLDEIAVLTPKANETVEAEQKDRLFLIFAKKGSQSKFAGGLGAPLMCCQLWRA